MKICILGGDGYLGWPTAMHFSARGHEVMVVDNVAKRSWEPEVGATGCHHSGDGGTWKREWDSVNAYDTLASLNTCKGCHGAAAADFTFGTAHNATDGQTEHTYNWDGDAGAEIMNAGTHNG